MKVFFEKLKAYRKKARYSIKEFAALLNVHRNSISAWEKGKSLPSGIKIREIAKILNVPVSEISNLALENKTPSVDLPKISSSWVKIGQMNKQDIESNSALITDLLEKIKKNIINSNIISKSLLSSLGSTVYIKDVNLRYLAVNYSFLDCLSLDRKKPVSGKKDTDFFPIAEAKENDEEDRKVLITGEEILAQERYLPGSRKRKYCLASKLPIIDDSGKIIGIIGEFTDITQRRKREINRIKLQYVLNKTDVYIWAGKGIKYDTKGYPIIRKLLFRVGGGIIKYCNKEEPNDIFTTLPQDIIETFREQEPESLKKELAKKIECGPYPIERRYRIKNPHTKAVFNLAEYIYYNKEDDILMGITIPLSNETEAEDTPSGKQLKDKLKKIENKLRELGVSEEIISESVYRE